MGWLASQSFTVQKKTSLIELEKAEQPFLTITPLGNY